MTKKTIGDLEPSFIQSINITKSWCKEWEEGLLSDEVFSDRVIELIKTKIGLRGFFAYTLSDFNCTLLDKLPYSFVFKLREKGESVVEITIKNLIMSSAQVINHQRDKNNDYAEASKNISFRCINLLRDLDTKLVSSHMNKIIENLDNMGNSLNEKILYDDEQKEYIKEQIKKIAY